MDLASLDLGSPLGTRVDSASVAVPRVARCASVLSGATSLAGSEAGSSPPSLSASPAKHQVMVSGCTGVRSCRPAGMHVGVGAHGRARGGERAGAWTGGWVGA